MKVYVNGIEASLDAEFGVKIILDNFDLAELLASEKIGCVTRVCRTHFSEKGLGQTKVIGTREFIIQMGEDESEDAPEEPQDKILEEQY